MAQFDLYQERVTKNVSRGLTEAVCIHVNRLQNRIALNDCGIIRNVYRRGNPPREKGTIGLHPQMTEKRNLPIVIVEDELKTGFFLASDDQIFITSWGFPEEAQIKQVHYFSYLVAVSLLELHIPDLKRHSEDMDCPFDESPHPKAARTMIKRGHLCNICEDKINDFAQRGAIDPGFLQAIRTILTETAAHYLPPKQEQQNEPQVRAFVKGLVDEFIQGRPGIAPSKAETAVDLLLKMGPFTQILAMARPDRERLGRYNSLREALKDARPQSAEDILRDLSTDQVSQVGPDRGPGLAQTVDFAEKQNGPAAEQVAPENPSVTITPPPVEAVGSTAGPDVVTTESADINSDASVEIPEGDSAFPGRVAVRNDDTDGPDLLGYTDYADAIADVVTNAETGTPLTIAIGGPWGRGKSKLLDLIRDAVDHPGRSGRRVQCEWIEINAWELGKTENISAEFYSRLVSDIQKKLGPFDRAMLSLRFAIKAGIIRSIIGALFLLLLFILGLYITINSLSIYQWDTSDIKWLELLGGVSAIVVAMFGAIWRFGSFVTRSFLKRLKSLSFPRTVGTEHEALRHMDTLVKLLRAFISTRFVVAVDDLDRCTPSKILGVLESIKLFLDSKGFVFILAMDCGVVTQAVGEHYRFMCSHRWQRRDVGREYLDKIIQVPFHLPALAGPELKNLVEEVLKPYSRKRNEEAPPGVRDANKGKVRRTTGSEVTATDPMTPEEESAEVLKREKSQKPHPEIPTLHTEENEAIERFIDEAGSEMSPRLAIRFCNVYMIARNIFILQWELRGDRNLTPPASFAYWIGLSVLYPAEAKRFLELLNETPNEPLDLKLDGHKFVLEGEWPDLSIVRVEGFKRLYAKLAIQHVDVIVNRTITDCFNLALD